VYATSDAFVLSRGYFVDTLPPHSAITTAATVVGDDANDDGVVVADTEEEGEEAKELTAVALSSP
jgi:hypothetical protein